MNRRAFFRDVLSAAALAWGAPLASRLVFDDKERIYSSQPMWVAIEDVSWEPIKPKFLHFVCVSVDYDTKTVTYGLPE